MATRKRKADGEEVQESPLYTAVMESEKYIPVEGNRDLVRDPTSNAILNINKKAHFRAVQMKQQSLQKVDEVAELKTEVAELKNMLSQLLEKVNANGIN